MNESTRRPLIAGNWKMNGSKVMADKLVDAIASGRPKNGAEVVVIPSFPFLDRLHSRTVGADFGLGAQDISAHACGAYTGEVSGEMLADVGAAYVLVGHSERREMHGESDEIVAAKFEAARAAGLKPILCVGETRAQRERDATESVVGGQIEAVVARCGASALADAVIAYEPVWAIGTGLVATPEQAQGVHAFIRALLARHDVILADQIRLIYGGSMKAQNAAELLACKDIDGGLVGGASLNADDFLAIIAASTPTRGA